nr:MAG TPA: hypothetical protein [Herelleviridae sp.]
MFYIEYFVRIQKSALLIFLKGMEGLYDNINS